MSAESLQMPEAFSSQHAVLLGRIHSFGGGGQPLPSEGFDLRSAVSDRVIKQGPSLPLQKHGYIKVATRAT